MTADGEFLCLEPRGSVSECVETAGFRVVGHIVFAKSYASKSTFVGYTHESAYLLAKGRRKPRTVPSRT